MAYREYVCALQCAGDLCTLGAHYVVQGGRGKHS